MKSPSLDLSVLCSKLLSVITRGGAQQGKVLHRKSSVLSWRGSAMKVHACPSYPLSFSPEG